jgi:hypothetical protein
VKIINMEKQKSTDVAQKVGELYRRLSPDDRVQIAIVMTIDGRDQPLTWNAAFLEVSAGTEIAQRICEGIDELGFLGSYPDPEEYRHPITDVEKRLTIEKIRSIDPNSEKIREIEKGTEAGVREVQGTMAFLRGYYYGAFH